MSFAAPGDCRQLTGKTARRCRSRPADPLACLIVATLASPLWSDQSDRIDQSVWQPGRQHTWRRATKTASRVRPEEGRSRRRTRRRGRHHGRRRLHHRRQAPAFAPARPVRHRHRPAAPHEPVRCDRSRHDRPRHDRPVAADTVDDGIRHRMSDDAGPSCPDAAPCSVRHRASSGPTPTPCHGRVGSAARAWANDPSWAPTPPV